MLLDGLNKLGIGTDGEPGGTFYIWGNLSKLPPELADGMSFFKKILEEKVIVVPGEFFDVNPGKRRPGRTSRFRSHARFSFGPSEDTLAEGLSRIEKLLRAGA